MSNNNIYNKKIIITIDGPSGSGKTSCGTLLSKKLNFQILDSGKIYRLFTIFLKNLKINWNKLNLETKKNINDFNVLFKDNNFYLNNKKIDDDKLNDLNIEKFTTKIINIKNVRYKINQICRNIIKDKNFILIGRDAGSVIFPEADFKFFLDASHKIRVERKNKLLKNQNKTINFDQELKKRLKKEEKENILLKSWDSFYIKNENLTIDETVNKILKIINQYLNNNSYKVGIIGEINVGKSSLFNLLVGKKEVIESSVENTTRDFFEKQIKINEKEITLIDTGGMEKEKNDFLLNKIWERNLNILNKFNLILWVTNFKTGITKNTNLINKNLKKYKDKIILVINKTEKEVKEENIKNWKKLGIKKMIFISVKRKINFLKLKNEISKNIISIEKKVDKKKYLEKNVLILGQTNNGKSTLFNQLLKTEKAITSSKEHTTTNIIKGFLVYNNIKLNFFDTAGIRKRRTNKSTLEKKSFEQILEKTQDFDVAIIVLNTTKPFFSQDIRIIGIIKKLKKPIILVGNKIDENTNGKRKIERDIKIFFKLLKEKTIVLTSSKTGEGCQKLLKILTKKEFYK